MYAQGLRAGQFTSERDIVIDELDVRTLTPEQRNTGVLPSIGFQYPLAGAINQLSYDGVLIP